MPIPGIFCAAAGIIPPNVIFVGSAEATSSASGGISVNKPTGMLTGDILVALLAAEDAATWAGPGSFTWTIVANQGVAPSLCVMVRTVAAGENASATFTHGVSTDNVGQIHCIRGVQYDAIGTIATRTDNGDLVIGGITSNGGLIFAASATSGDPFAAHSTPSGMLMIDNTNNSNGVGLTSFRQRVDTGATGTRTSTVSAVGVSDPSAGVVIGLKPA